MRKLFSILLAILLIMHTTSAVFAAPSEDGTPMMPAGEIVAEESGGETQAPPEDILPEPLEETTEEPPPQETVSPTEETQAPSEEPPTQPPAQPQMPTVLSIDTQNTYHGMDCAYEAGYMPRVENGYANIIIPLKTNGSMYLDAVKASLNLGGSSSPFVLASYEKLFPLETVTPKNTAEPQQVFFVNFSVQLRSDRVNGVYPVVVTVSGYDSAAIKLSESYTVYVTITDGKSNSIPVPSVEKPTAEPVVYIANVESQPETILAGEPFTLTFTLRNSLTCKSVRNMLVKVDTGNLQINLEEDSNVFPISKIAAGEETTLSLHFRSDASITAGKYSLTLNFNYDSSQTLNLSSSGSSIIEISQPANMELVMPRFPDSVTIGETLPLSLQVMNMGRSKMYNVRCTVSGFGFAPSNTGYIGTMEAGSSATTKVDLYIIALNVSKGNETANQYGPTTGTITLTYEDATGQEFSQTLDFETEVKRAISQIVAQDQTEEENEKRVGAWWQSILILGGVLGAAILGLYLRKRKAHKKDFSV